MATSFKVTVLQAYNMNYDKKKADKMKVVVEYKEKSRETEWTQLPKWHQTFEFPLDEDMRRSLGELTLYVWRKGSGKKVIFLGRVAVSLAEHTSVIWEAASDHRFELKSRGNKNDPKTSGQLCMKIGFILPLKLKNKRVRQGHKLREGERAVRALGLIDEYGEASTQELLEEADDVATESRDSALRSLDLLERTNHTGRDTLEQLYRQGHQISRVQEDLDDIGKMQIQADNHLKAIDSVIGVAEVKAMKMDKLGIVADRQEDTNKKARQRAKKEVKKLKEKDKEEAKRKKKEQSKYGKDKKPTKSASKLNHDETSVLLPETQSKLSEVDSCLDRISDLLDDTKFMALDMRDEVAAHNARLDVMQVSMDQTYAKTRRNNRKTAGML